MVCIESVVHSFGCATDACLQLVCSYDNFVLFVLSLPLLLVRQFGCHILIVNQPLSMQPKTSDNAKAIVPTFQRSRPSKHDLQSSDRCPLSTPFLTDKPFLPLATCTLAFRLRHAEGGLSSM